MSFIDRDDLKLELGITDTGNDLLLTVLAEAIESLWDKLTGKTWAKTTYVEYYSSRQGDSRIILDNFPVISVTSIYNDDDWVYGENTKVDTDDYTCNLDTGVVFYNGAFSEGGNNLKITYIAGYEDAGVPAWLKQVLVRQACHWFKQAKDQRWDINSKAEPAGGGTISYKGLENNLLPDFAILVERNRKSITPS